MSIKPTNTKPFWSLIILIILVLAFRISIVTVLYKVTNEAMVQSVLPGIIWQTVLALIILIAEALVYWIIRRRFYKMSWVWTHVILLYFVLIVLPLLYNLVIYFLGQYIGSGNYFEVTTTIATIQLILYWSSVLIAHIFFVLTIVKSNWRIKSAESSTDEPANLLDEFNG